MEAVAKLKNCPMSARKMRLVVDNIRGKNVNQALGILKFTKRESATWLEKVLMSAIANWEYKLDNTESADDYDLVVKTVMVDEGAVLKRFRPAPHGRAHPIRKRTCHATIVVENRLKLESEQEESSIEQDKE
jgi:large subunit ribosomal protein L22